MEQHQISWKKYIYAFVITAIIFATAIYLSNYSSRKKSTTFATFKTKFPSTSCRAKRNFAFGGVVLRRPRGQSALSDELGSLEDKLTYTERDRGTNDPEVQTLKQYYSLLEIKDYI